MLQVAGGRTPRQNNPVGARAPYWGVVTFAPAPAKLVQNRLSLAHRRHPRRAATGKGIRIGYSAACGSVCGARIGYSAACGTASPSFTPRTAYSAATRTASIMLTALALPVPAMSNAVP